jgi:hypothetical protein
MVSLVLTPACHLASARQTESVQSRHHCRVIESPGEPVSRPGLSEREVERRLAQHGPNTIERRERPNRLRDLAAQFTHPLALLLWVAAALAAATGVAPLALAIVAVIVLNAVFAFGQELEAERATEALREFLPPQARVRRGGKEIRIDAVGLVPGDLLLVEEGDRLSADARLVAGDVEIDASPLTGESQPVVRSAAPSPPTASPLEAANLVFSGTLCTAGEAEAVILATGMGTQRRPDLPAAPEGPLRHRGARPVADRDPRSLPLPGPGLRRAAPLGAQAPSVMSLRPRHDQQWTRRDPDQLLCHRAEQDPGQRAVAARARNEQVNPMPITIASNPSRSARSVRMPAADPPPNARVIGKGS